MEKGYMFKLKLWASAEDEEVAFIDLYLDVTNITGFYLPMGENPGGESAINIFVNGDSLTIKAEEHIKAYLLERFVTYAVNN